MRDSIFIDTNIFLYAIDARDSYKQDIAKKIIFEKNCTISIQVINEAQLIIQQAGDEKRQCGRESMTIAVYQRTNDVG